ncbi:MFS transporter [Gluconacetobacter tumulicola]|uniref:MFS transporter n=1 Tax=Gluconacetobacter tumulicola TaxID=1017177 RepID=A0A7W4P7U7_9PROT|nr:MFS transporter [Gluconacetobacter tumulicola]MBB2180761.1 MFS transporter [Gluconacetobacter tumulicola]
MTVTRTGSPSALSHSNQLGRGLVATMSVATGLAAASQYYNQPVLGLIGDGFAVGAHVSIVATATQIGYALGLLLLVPLGDRVDRRRLILLQCLGLTLTMLAASAATELSALTVASVMIGVFATIAQQILPFAAELAPADERERVLGTITSGLLIGVLLARTLSGFVGAWLGWRAVFAVGAVIAALMFAGLAAQLPRSRPETSEPYTQLLLSLLRAARNSRVLRRATLTQSLLFFGFSAFWTILALLLQGPRFNLGSGIAGLFGAPALLGVILAPPAIRIAGKNAVPVGVALVILSFINMGFLANLISIGVGVVLLVAGLQIALISNQSRVFAVAGAARGRFNTVFMATQFTFGAAGSAAASIAWEASGWSAVMIMAAVSAALALLMQIGSRA